MVRALCAVLIVLMFAIPAAAQETKPRASQETKPEKEKKAGTGSTGAPQESPDPVKVLNKKVDEVTADIAKLRLLPPDPASRIASALENIAMDTKTTWNWMFVVALIVGLVLIVSFWVAIPRNLAEVAKQLSTAADPLGTLAFNFGNVAKLLGTATPQVGIATEHLGALAARLEPLPTRIENLTARLDAVATALPRLETLAARLDAAVAKLDDAAGKLGRSTD